jgi:hypothetical protein
MAALHESMASLRIGGDKLDPDEITDLLGCAPSTKARKGGVLGKGRVKAKTGTWQLDASLRTPGDIEAQVREILGRIDFDKWDRIVDQYDVDIFCGLFMSETDEGLSISADLSAMLGERRIRLEMCLYGPLSSDAK